MVKKNDFRYPVPSQPVTKHSHRPLVVHKRSAREVLVLWYPRAAGVPRPSPSPPEWRTPLFHFPTLTELSAMQVIQKTLDSGGGQLTKL